MSDLKKILLDYGIGAEYQERFDFSSSSTIGVGGKTLGIVYPSTLKEVVKLIDLFEEQGIEYLVLGNMSNVLPPDSFLKKVVVSTLKLKNTEFSKGVFSEAGARSGPFLDECEKYGYTGAEFLAGIPCTIGGAVYMNAGANGKYISDIIKRVLVYEGKQLRLLPRSACAFGYKKSRFMQKDSVILGVEFDLQRCDPTLVKENRLSVLKFRRDLPKGKSAGCIFKNPLGDSAGRLIEGAGLKGFRVGGAVVSEKHANFIINEGNATSEEIISLISIIKNAVYKKYKILLEEEVRILE